jgi:hypothetical protein
VVVVDIEHSQILFVLEAVCNRCGTSLSNTVIVKEEHVEADMGPESSTDFGDHTVVELVFTQVDSSELLLVVDTFAEGFTKSGGEFVLTDI